ncbi:MAG: hypothetical protein HY319_13250 [Armatimonadetes bacterium]|nr:hypothetical protein [Armatimonadota bacterium]
MLVTRRMPSPQTAASAPPSPPGSPEESKDDSAEPTLRETYRKGVTTAFFASGGAFGGYHLGAVVGSLVTGLGARTAYLTYGPIMGAALGGSWGVLAYRGNADDPATKFLRAGAMAASGGSLGTVACDVLGYAVAGITGNPAYASYGAMAGTISGTLAGVAHNYKDSKDPASRIAKGAASLAGGATAGWFLGGVVGTTVASMAGIPQVAAVTPGLMAGAVGVSCLAAYLNWEDRQPEAAR